MALHKTMKRKKKRLSRFLPPILVLLFVLPLIGCALFLVQKSEAIPSENLSFPVGHSVTIQELVLEVKNGTLLNGDQIITSRQAKQVTVSIQTRNRVGMDNEQSLTVNFFDSLAPVITAPDSLSIVAGETPDLMKDVSAADNSGEALTAVLTGEYDCNRPGTYELFFEACDASGNQAKKPFTLTVRFEPFGEDGKPKEGSYITPTGHLLEIKEGIAYVDGHLLANKSYSLPKDYMGGARVLTAETNTAFQTMKNAAKAEGINIFMKSGTRNWNDQNYIFNNYVKSDGLENALTYSARPGHSEHQSGMGMDLVTSSSQAAESDPTIKAALAWLNQNAWKYGLILRYPEGKSNETGYIFEPWHYRYVGTELAEILYNNGDWITMEAYFGVDSVYRGY
jgi:hypothetical protein